jgi:uncharacterized Fe-S cluster-containing MiaB family protein
MSINGLCESRCLRPCLLGSMLQNGSLYRLPWLWSLHGVLVRCAGQHAMHCNTRAAKRELALPRCSMLSVALRISLQ